jgi:hypothetical protein
MLGKELCIQGKCIPEMRKDRVYFLLINRPWILLPQNVGVREVKVRVLVVSMLRPCAMLLLNIVGMEGRPTFLPAQKSCKVGTEEVRGYSCSGLVTEER